MRHGDGDGRGRQADSPLVGLGGAVRGEKLGRRRARWRVSVARWSGRWSRESGTRNQADGKEAEKLLISSNSNKDSLFR